MANHKPKPPPLDEGEQNAAGSPSNVPHAESGRATPEDAARAAADAARAAAAAASPSAPSDAGTARDTPSPDDEVPPPRAGASDDEVQPPVLYADSGGQFIARPNPAVPVDPRVDLVLGNWFGHVRRDDAVVQVHVKHGTRFDALPRDVQHAIRRTKGISVGPLPPKQPQNPFQP